MPITSPLASSSGPPELPGLIEASVWIALSIANSVSDWIERSVAETIPIESDCCSPNGLPIAATGSPTANSSRSEMFRWLQVEAVRVDLDQRDVGVGIEADDVRRHAVAVAQLDVDLLRLPRLPAAVALAAGGDDVGVGDDLALVADDESGALAGAAAERSRRSRRRWR